MTCKKSQSDRKLTEAQYVKARGPFLRRQRDFFRKIGIIVKKPVNYEDVKDIHEEIWDDDDTEKIDADRVYNIDEVPLNIVSLSQCLRRKYERSNLKNTLMKQMDKYRKGSLVILSNNTGIKLIMIIFKCEGGGQQVEKEANEHLCGNQGTKVIWTTSKSGSLRDKQWVMMLNAVANMTKVQRGCKDLSGNDWKRTIAILVDNYSVHIKNKTANCFARRYGMFVCCLIANASHLQQPVDQNIGNQVKLNMNNFLDDKVIYMERLNELGSDQVVSVSKFREYLISYVAQSVLKLNKERHRYLHIASWINYGLYLPLDGHLDDEPLTLLTTQDRNVDDIQQRHKQYDLMFEKSCIKKRSRGSYSITRQHDLNNLQQIAQDYNLESSKRNARDISTADSILLRSIRSDVQEMHQRRLNWIQSVGQQDQSKSNVFVPSLNDMISAEEIMSLKRIFDKHPHDTYDTEWMFTEYFKIPMRNEHGIIVKAAGIVHNSNEALNIEFQQHSQVVETLPRVPMYPNELQTPFNDDIKYVPTDIVSKALDDLAIDAKFYNDDVNIAFTPQQIQDIRIEKEIDRNDYYLDYTDSNGLKVMMEIWSYIIYDELPSWSQVKIWNWAMNRGGTPGFTNLPMQKIHECFQMFFETQTGMHLITTDSTARRDRQNLVDFVNAKIENKKHTKIIIVDDSKRLSWITSWLYVFASDTMLMGQYERNASNNDGDTLMFKLLEILQISTIAGDVSALSMLLQFIEVLQIGHHCAHMQLHDVFTGLKILHSVSNILRSSTRVRYYSTSICRDNNCRHDSLRQVHHESLLMLNGEADWIDSGEWFRIGNRFRYDCESDSCQCRAKTRFYKVLNDQHDFLGIYFKNGPCEKLWKHIIQNNNVRIGDQIRAVRKAIFETCHGEYYCAFLYVNKMNNRRGWYVLDSTKQRVTSIRGQSFKKINSRFACRIIFFQEPAKCYHCRNTPTMNDNDLAYCNTCNELVHTRCLERNCPVVNNR